ncbi:sodium bile acid symporter family protein [Apiospora kogelbergensis]|uniref:sodium bile acid symporter family protein n=1 Tax=Apiospora kogelbergensis TaxID=1337665 RepID=UPI00313055B1
MSARPDIPMLASDKPSPSPLAYGGLIKDQWVLIALVVLVVLSSQVQVPEEQQGVKTSVVQKLTIAIIFFINGLTTPTEDLVESIRRWRCHLYVQAMSFFFTSLTMLGLVMALASNRGLMDPELLNGLIILGCLPTAFSVNTIMTRKAGGNATLTLTQSVVGNVIGPFLSLLLVHGYMSISVWDPDVMPRSTGGFGELLKRVFTQFGLTLLLPLAAGQVVRSFSPETAKKIMHDYQVIKLASLSLLVMIWSGYGSAFASHAFADTNEHQLLSVVIICASLFVVWMLVSVAVSITFLGRSDTVAVAFCIPTKSPALGIPLATILFAGCSEEVMAKVYIPLIIFQLIQTCLSNVATLPFRHWKTKTDSQTESNAREL